MRIKKSEIEISTITFLKEEENGKQSIFLVKMQIEKGMIKKLLEINIYDF